MQSIDTHHADHPQPRKTTSEFDAGRVEDLAEGSCKSLKLPTGREVALYKVDGEFYATENFCPHQGASLSEGLLCGHVIECDRHGWQFDVRTGECLTVPENIQTFAVVLEDGNVKIMSEEE